MIKVVIIVIVAVAPVKRLGMCLQLRPAFRGELANGGGIDRAIERIHPRTRSCRATTEEEPVSEECK